MLKPRVLILSPIGDVGGRELEVGFIASVLSSKYNVKVLSTGNYTHNSQVKAFKGFSVTSLKYKIFDSSLFVRVFIKLISHFKKSISYDASSLSAPLIKKILNVQKRKIKILNKEILKTDIVFISAQLSSNYIKDIILIAKINKKSIVFRTTGNITENIDFSYLKYVDVFIHHSLRNAQKLNRNYRYNIIDQCAFNEENFLKVPALNSKVNNFMTVSRIEKNKNIDVVINSFCKSEDINDKLYVVGNGPDLEDLKAKTKDKRVIFTGFIQNNELQEIYKNCQCFIVSYYQLEAGPLTAIEAMAAGKILISSKTGAMTERLTGKYAFWHDNTVKLLSEKIKEIKMFSKDEVAEISKFNRERYVSEYSIEIISKKYLDAVSSLN
ncbi:glycosyltransferase family 4 protein [Polaribacter pectinis]|uniref:Glycosyltransferase family 4 protein n=1 Tax=Polaribacter pectinis TaxID=2738844 RepID=A0A7G9LCB0_9FLAO|nr:glycosyltransferase family 4 protein [Polaribacter pectinis]QNM86259.1 glycosyltransferase family 4 protein [Polaribacter pectinis]